MIPATGHSYGPWQYTTPAGTPEKERIVARTCEICGYEHSEYAFNVDSSLLPEAPPDATQLDTLYILISVIAAVVVCFVGVEIYLVRKKKKTR
jgi:hypothetical protein